MRPFLHIALFANLFYGACAVALSIENNLQLGLPLNHWIYYVFIFCSTTYFYNLSYTHDPSPSPANLRAVWLHRHKNWLDKIQIICLLLMAASAVYYGWLIWWHFELLKVWQVVLSGTVPIVAFLYYGFSFPGVFRLNLRSHGWFKPFVVGGVWAGTVNIISTSALVPDHQEPIAFDPNLLWFFCKNWMFITVLAIMFDIKDYAADHNRDLKTFVVRVGLRRTIHRIIIPLVLAGLLSYLLFVWNHHFSAGRIIINLLPFLFLLAIAYSLQQRRSILYYLLIIDGLMLVKACCGIMGATWFG